MSITDQPPGAEENGEDVELLPDEGGLEVPVEEDEEEVPSPEPEPVPEEESFDSD